MNEDIWNEKPEPEVPTYEGHPLKSWDGYDWAELWYRHASMELWLRKLRKKWDELCKEIDEP